MTAITIRRTGGRAIPLVQQRVYVGGVLRRDIEIIGGSHSQGLGGSRLSCYLPQALYDADPSSLYGREVVAYAWHDGETQGPPIFRGLVDAIDGTLSVGDDTQGFVCRSWMHYLNRVQLGQKTLSGQVNFRRLDKSTGDRRNWTIGTIVREAFGGSYWPNDWTGLMELGDVSVLSSGTATQDLATDVLFTSATYAEFLAHVLALAGDIGVRERFTDSITYLDFYRLGPQPGATRVFTVASIGDVVGVDDVNVLALDQSRDLGDLATRVIGYGAPKEMIVTIATDHADGPLVPLWDNATAYDAPGPFTADEQGVLDDPESAIPGSPTFVPGREHIFRRFAIPAALRNFRMLDRLPVEDAAGRPLPPHAYLFEYELEQGTVDGVTAMVAGDENEDPTLLAIEGFDSERGIVTLQYPAIVLTQAIPGDTGTKYTWERQQVALTCAFALEGKECGYDTGVRSTIDVAGLGDDGVVMTFSRPDLRFIQFTSYDLGVYADDGVTTLEYDALVWDGSAWNDYALTASGVRDDRPTIARIAEGALRARSRQRTQFAVTLDYFTQGVKVGDTIRVNQSGTMSVPVQVQGISFVCSADPGTRIHASDAIPEETVFAQEPTGTKIGKGPAAGGPGRARTPGRHAGAPSAGVAQPQSHTPSASTGQVAMGAPLPPPVAPRNWMQGVISTISTSRGSKLG